MPTSASQRAQKRRDALRAAGLRPVQIWVPDTRRPGFEAENGGAKLGHGSGGIVLLRAV
jgi:hypothetical protein